MIGLREWKVPGRNLDFGLRNDGRQVYTGTFIDVKYDYFTVIKKGG